MMCLSQELILADTITPKGDDDGKRLKRLEVSREMRRGGRRGFAGFGAPKWC